MIRRAHGVRGDVIVELGTHRTDRLDPGSRVLAGDQWRTVTASRPYQDRWLVTFAGVDSRDAAQRLTGTALYAEPVDDPDVVWVHELIGARVIEVDGTDRGRCVGVVANPASDLLELASGVLVPAVFIHGVSGNAAGDDDHGLTVTIDPPDGLFDDSP